MTAHISAGPSSCSRSSRPHGPRVHAGQRTEGWFSSRTAGW